MLAPALQIVIPAAAVGFGVGAVATWASTPKAPAAGRVPCVNGAWSLPRAPSAALVERLRLPAILTLSQFPRWPLAEHAQIQGFEVLEATFDAVVERGDVLALPQVEGSPIPAQEVVVRTALERVQVLSAFGGAVAGAAIAPACTFAAPLSDEVLDDERVQDVQRALEQLAVVALAQRDGRMIRVDVDPLVTRIEEEGEICVPPDVVLPLRAPTILAPQIGDDPEDRSWPISHDAQVSLYHALLEALADPAQTAPLTTALIALAPECPWGDKIGYGLDMTTLWYAAGRLEKIAAADLASWGGTLP